MLGANDAVKKHLTVWNWHGDTNHVGELVPRIVYNGPEKDYSPGNPSQRGRRSK